MGGENAPKPLELHRIGRQNDAPPIYNIKKSIIKTSRSVPFHTNYPSYHLLRDYPQYLYRQVTYFRTKSLLDLS